MPSIRPLAICLFSHNGKILVAEYQDVVKPEIFFRPVGGGIEYGEYAADTIARETMEELGVAVRNVHYLYTLENLFVYEGTGGHEIVLVFDGSFVDESLYARPILVGTDRYGPYDAVWMSRERAGAGCTPAVSVWSIGKIELAMKVNKQILSALVLLLWVSSAFAFFAPGLLDAQSPAPRVDVAKIEGVIDPFTEGYVERVINLAHEDGASAIVFQLNTPGGGLDPTRKIVERFFDSPVPILVYVSPSGARAGSAGVFLTYAGHIAAMAPGTNIGAASPVSVSGELGETMETKVTNDAAALIRSIATQRKRNVEWGEDAVRTAASITDQEAAANGAIDFIARDVTDLLNQANGRVVQVQGQDVTLNTLNADVHQVEMNFFEQFFHFLLDPNIALILLNLGTIALIAEVYNPGAVLPAIIGVICLTLAAVALFGLPTNWAAVILIIAGIGMMVLDIKVTGFALTVGGIIAFLLGAFFLFRPFTFSAPEPMTPDISVSPWVIGALTLFTTLFFVIVVAAAIRARSVPVITGIQTYIGALGVAKTMLNPQGTILVKSEDWTAVAQDPPIQAGESVRVLSAEGLTLRVEKIAQK